ncbi:MAG: hypothetical protein LBR82_01275 [Desulfovibrio sp.]|nr:hypothetical protein [Desulfovibrio sp.]
MPDAQQEAGAGRNKGRGSVLPLVLSGAFLAALALSLVWLNIERTKLAYRARNLQRELEQALDLGAKLKAEREHLLSPHELGKKAEALGLGPAKPGHIRRMDSGTQPEKAAGK